MSNTRPDSKHEERKRFTSVPIWLFGALFVYVLSSGPVLAGACWLREATHHNEFYYAFYPYWPLLYLTRTPGFKTIFFPIDIYIEWWFQLFDTVGPG